MVGFIRYFYVRRRHRINFIGTAASFARHDYVYIKFPSTALDDKPTVDGASQPRIIVILTITIIVKATQRLLTTVYVTSVCSVCLRFCWINKFVAVVGRDSSDLFIPISSCCRCSTVYGYINIHTYTSHPESQNMHSRITYLACVFLCVRTNRGRTSKKL